MATITITKTTSNAATLMLCNALIVLIIANLVLSVDAILCHQCNSHLEQECSHLPAGDTKFLKECENHTGGERFCRKTVFDIDVTGEHRVVRSCGWIHTDHINKTNFCYTADNEGYQQLICSCTTDGCNSAPARYANSNLLLLCAVAGMFVAVAAPYRR